MKDKAAQQGMPQTENKINLAEGQSPILLWGTIFIVILALAVWLLYAFRSVQIQTTTSKINSIKKEITSQIGEDELAQLETITGQMAILYGRPFATNMLKDISGAIPKNAALSSANFSGTQITLQGRAASYDDVSLFVSALYNQASALKNMEIANASQSVSIDQPGVDFTLQAKIK